MNQPREQRRFSDFSPLLLAVAATLFGLAMGKTHGAIWVKIAGSLLLAGALAVRYLLSRKLGLYLLIGVCVAYVATGLIFEWSFRWSWIAFVGAAFLLDWLLGVTYVGTDALHRQLEYQRERSERGALVDESSQLRNLRSYQNDAGIYIRIAKRHHLSLGLVLWRLDNASELRRRVGESEYAQLIRRVSRQLRSSLRYEDMIFLIEDTSDTLLWGTLHVANSSDVCRIVERRLRGKLAKLELPEGMELRISTWGSVADDDVTLSPMDLLEAARAKMKEPSADKLG